MVVKPPKHKIKGLKMRYFALGIAALFVAGCEAQVPNSGANSGSGVGFDSYVDYHLQPEVQVAGTGGVAVGAEISNETIAGGANVPQATTPLAPLVAPTTNNPGISDEQDFSAVSSRESIQSDAQRRAAQQQAYQIIAPTALPTRSGGSGSSIVDFALTTSNLVGQSIYPRSSLSGANRYQRNCAKYASSDMAQIAFLKAGGPTKDRKGVDPDGDGFACFWDPTPFRQAVRN